MIFLVILIILFLSISAAKGYVLGVAGDFAIYKNLLFDLNNLNFNLDDMNLVGADLWQETRRYGFVWILIMKFHTILFGDNFQFFIFNLSCITLSIKFFFFKTLHKLRHQTFVTFLLYISTLFILQESLRIRASLSVCFAIAFIYFFNKVNNLKNIFKIIYLIISILCIFASLNINVNGLFLASIFLFDRYGNKFKFLSKVTNFKSLGTRLSVSFLVLIAGFIFKNIFIDLLLNYGTKGIFPRLFPYLISESNYFSALFIIPIILTLICANLISSSKTKYLQSSHITPFYISLVLGIVIQSQYLLYGVLNMSYFYFLSFGENLSKNTLLFVLLMLTGYYFLIRTLPLVLLN